MFRDDLECRMRRMCLRPPVGACSSLTLGAVIEFLLLCSDESFKFSSRRCVLQHTSCPAKWHHESPSTAPMLVPCHLSQMRSCVAAARVELCGLTLSHSWSARLTGICGAPGAMCRHLCTLLL